MDRADRRRCGNGRCDRSASPEQHDERASARGRCGAPRPQDGAADRVRATHRPEDRPCRSGSRDRGARSATRDSGTGGRSAAHAQGTGARRQGGLGRRARPAGASERRTRGDTGVLRARPRGTAACHARRRDGPVDAVRDRPRAPDRLSRDDRCQAPRHGGVPAGSRTRGRDAARGLRQDHPRRLRAYRDAVAELERAFEAAEHAARVQAGEAPPNAAWQDAAQDMLSRSAEAIDRAAGAAASAIAAWTNRKKPGKPDDRP